MSSTAVSDVPSGGDGRTWLETLLGLTLVLNLVDLILTVLVVKTELAVEANPFMALLLEGGPLPFAIAKLAIVSIGVWVLWLNREKRLAAAGAATVFSAYLFVMFWHVQSVQALVQTQL